MKTCNCNCNTLCTTPTWSTGKLSTTMGNVTQISTNLTKRDYLGAIAVRLNIGRMDYSVAPGLYAIGSPGSDSPVLVSANYKLSFDRLRQALEGIDSWILVLDTKGINVWCAAGKGSFSTNEILRKIQENKLLDLVSHRKIIVPQLGAPGVSAHDVKKKSGFQVVYGPVRAKDIPAFLNNNMQATPEMRRVRFSFMDRLVLIPIELIQWSQYAFFVAVCFFFLAGMNKEGYSWKLVLQEGTKSALSVLGCFIASGMLVPILLPWLPGRAFSIKGSIVGLAIAMILFSCQNLTPCEIAAWLLLLPAIASFMGMNFTGATPYTSLSGVRKEMRYAVPIQIICAVVGLLLWIISRFI